MNYSLVLPALCVGGKMIALENCEEQHFPKMWLGTQGYLCIVIVIFIISVCGKLALLLIKHGILLVANSFNLQLITHTVAQAASKGAKSRFCALYEKNNCGPF